MSWTYTNAPSTVSAQGLIDAVRVMINDLSTARPLRSDQAITFALGQEGNDLYRTCAWLCDSLADSEAVSARVGDLALGAEKPINYRALAASYRLQSAIRGAMPVMVAHSSALKSGVEQDSDRVKPFFTRSMMQPTGLQVGTTGST